MHIRAATAADWPGIWAFMRLILAAGETYTYPRDMDEEAARAVWTPPAPGRTLVAVDGGGSEGGSAGDGGAGGGAGGGGAGGTVLGTAKLHPNQMGGGAHVANASFMVAPGAAGRGVGRALGHHVLDQARQDGYRAMQFNAVVESNTRAVALWRSLGFEILATVPEGFHHPVKGYVGLHVMHRRL
ncbi:GNAT family N-acetyltransferase [Streptomyces zingiberis]|nr:GNAT family N-acetyltransferase [Streptomyces zingiberis]